VQNESENRRIPVPRFHEFRTADQALPDAPAPSLFTAIQQQLGLRLESAKGPVEFLVVDHIERPTTN
jgi:uncharacterized protein (TIGR03435 family)